jgi:hypothetical protein
MKADMTKTFSDLLRQLGFGEKLIESLGADGGRMVSVNVEIDESTDMFTIGQRAKQVKAIVRVTWMIHDQAE